MLLLLKFIYERFDERETEDICVGSHFKIGVSSRRGPGQFNVGVVLGLFTHAYNFPPNLNEVLAPKIQQLFSVYF